jgi:S1-C subfamily serine protease
VAGTDVGQTVALTVLRDVDGKLEKRTVTATLADRADYLRDTDSSSSDKADAPRSNSVRLGLTLAELTPQLIAEKHLEGVKGLYVKDVDPNGLAAEMPEAVRISAGEVITRVNRVPVTTLAEFQRVIESLKPGDAVVLNLSNYFRPQNRITSRIVQFSYQ